MNFQFEGLFKPQGWICPKCGNVYSPMWITCVSCNSSRFVIDIPVPAQDKQDEPIDEENEENLA